MKLLSVVVAIPVVFVAWQWWGDRSLEHALAPVASEIAGRDVSVDCQSLWGSLLDIQPREGEVRFDAAGHPEPRLFLTRRTCNRLRAFRKLTTHAELECLRSVAWDKEVALSFQSACYQTASPAIEAVLVLAHEAYHTAGSIDEAATNCYAIQAMAFTAVRLGAPEDEGRLLATAMAALEPYQPEGYATTHCRAGDTFDLHPETPEFPTERVVSPPLGRMVALATQ